MVDVGAKQETHRIAVAAGTIRMQPATLDLIQSGNAKKGDVLGIARIAAIMGAKRTSDLVPLCHPLPITRVAVDFEVDAPNNSVHCRAQVETVGKTGVEMEALTAVQVGLLTIYDMCKAADRGMVMTNVRVLEKHGGKSTSLHEQGAAFAPGRVLRGLKPAAAAAASSARRSRSCRPGHRILPARAGHPSRTRQSGPGPWPLLVALAGR